jgi:hypothetical protein
MLKRFIDWIFSIFSPAEPESDEDWMDRQW